jgi:dTDP-4-amino-4,6-dideoxygalactose transaminase
MREWAPGVHLPGTEQAAATHLAIPMSPVLSAEQAEQVVGAIAAAKRVAV